MILISYTNYSDKKLIEDINDNYHLQLFSGIYLQPGEILRDYKIVSKIRTELSSKDGYHENAGILVPTLETLYAGAKSY